MSGSIPDNSFNIGLLELAEIVNFDKRLDSTLLEQLEDTHGGVQGLSNRLRTDLKDGLDLKYIHLKHAHYSPDANNGGDMTVIDHLERITVFGENIIPPPRSPTILEIVVATIVEDPILKILIAGAIIVLSLGTAICPSSGYIEGLAIVIAVVVVLSVTAGSDWTKDRKFKKLLLLQTDKKCRVVRGGVKNEISSWDILVGDIIELVVGDEVPSDGIFISGNRLVIDESPLTVSEGSGMMLVTAVGVHSSGGKIQEMLNEAQDVMTPLQEKLKDVAILIGKVGVFAGIVTFIALAIRWGIDIANNIPSTTSDCSGASPSSGTDILSRLAAIVEDFVISITVVVVAVPEGLPLAVTLSLSLSMFKMMKDKCFVRHLDASETMGQATAICTDKTGTLTYNRMSVVRLLVGGNVYKGEGSGDRDAVPFTPKTFSEDLQALLVEGICINSTCFIKNDATLDELGVLPVFVGSATEGSLLILAHKLGVSYKVIREKLKIVENCIWSFTAERKRMSTLIERPIGYRLYTKGASEIILGLCTHVLNTETFEKDLMTQQQINLITKNIKSWASEGLRTFALAFKDTEIKLSTMSDEDVETDLVFLSLIAIKDPLRREIPSAVALCQKAGLTVRMVTGDNILTATKIAKECNIFFGDGVAIEGPAFRVLSDEAKVAMIPRLQVILINKVMARCSPADKFELVALLKSMGEVVAVTGDGTNDAPALKEADIGFSMGISGTQIAMNASDIVLLDDNFASIVQAIKWGRNVLATIRKFLQFQLGINLCAVIITFLGSVITGSSPLSTVQLLWINLIMDSFGAIALASEDPDPNTLNEQPQRRDDELLTLDMKRYIIVQTIYQTIILMVLITSADKIFPINIAFTRAEGLMGTPSKRARSLVFNTFILMQLSNIVCARTLRGEINVCSGFFKNKYFLSVLFTILAVQIFAIAVASSLFNAVPLSLEEWGYCIIFCVANFPVVLISRIMFRFYDSIYKKKQYKQIRHDKSNVSIKMSGEDEERLNVKKSVADITSGGVVGFALPNTLRSKSLSSIRSETSDQAELVDQTEQAQ